MSNSNGKKFKGVTARTPNQKRFIQAVNEKDFILVQGCFGTGKTYIAIGLACEFYLREKIEKIIFCRTSSQMIKDYGYAPGTYQEKSREFFQQHIEYFEQFLGRPKFEELWKGNVIELTSTSIIRGRNFKSSLVIMDECQHSSKEDLILFLSRLDKGSKAIIMGDEDQNGGPTGFFGKLVRNLEDENLETVMLTEEDIMRHSKVYQICKKIKAI